MMNNEQRLHYYRRFGWVPLPSRTMPEKVQQVLRCGRWRLQMKMCFRNCQKLVLDAHEFAIEGLQYCEGFYNIHNLSIPHAWLHVDGHHVDPTLQEQPSERYTEESQYDVGTILRKVLDTKRWNPIGSLDRDRQTMLLQEWFEEHHAKLKL